MSSLTNKDPILEKKSPIWRTRSFKKIICFQVAIDNTVYEDVDDDKIFFTKLFNEQSISCLPASVSE
jgi:hypothetical protein